MPQVDFHRHQLFVPIWKANDIGFLSLLLAYHIMNWCNPYLESYEVFGRNSNRSVGEGLNSRNTGCPCAEVVKYSPAKKKKKQHPELIIYKM